ncbi:MAG: hypothetical protein AB1324_02445 [Candidatus Micrarchaeota archaeon]
MENVSSMNDTQKKAVRRRNAAYIIGAGALVAASFFSRYLEQPDPAPQPRQCEPVQCPEVASNDGICAMTLGEADRRATASYDPACGECGNGRRDPQETPLNCPADFHCGNGHVDENEPYSVFTQRNGAWVLREPIVITESCNPSDQNYCEVDCAQIRVVRRRRTLQGDAGAPAVEEPDRIIRCPPEVSSADFSGSARAVETAIRRAVAERSAELRRQAGTSNGSDVVIYFSLTSTPSGSLSQQRATMTCDGAPCPQAVDVSAAINLDIGSFSIEAPRVTCYWPLSVRAPRVLAPVPQIRE